MANVIGCFHLTIAGVRRSGIVATQRKFLSNHRLAPFPNQWSWNEDVSEHIVHLEDRIPAADRPLVHLGNSSRGQHIPFPNPPRDKTPPFPLSQFHRPSDAQRHFHKETEDL